MKTLAHWQGDPDLAGVRDDAALERLPEEVRQAWRELWAEVGELPNHIPHSRFDRRFVTVSLGVASTEQGVANIEELLKGADEAVYAAKRGGRNQVRRFDAMDRIVEQGNPPAPRERAA
jgi:GGDEF domain-containing protein